MNLPNFVDSAACDSATSLKSDFVHRQSTVRKHFERQDDQSGGQGGSCGSQCCPSSQNRALQV